MAPLVTENKPYSIICYCSVHICYCLAPLVSLTSLFLNASENIVIFSFLRVMSLLHYRIVFPLGDRMKEKCTCRGYAALLVCQEMAIKSVFWAEKGIGTIYDDMKDSPSQSNITVVTESISSLANSLLILAQAIFACLGKFECRKALKIFIPTGLDRIDATFQMRCSITLIAQGLRFR